MSVLISLLEMAAVAAGTSSRSGRTPFYLVTAEEAREYVSVKDGNRKPAKDGSKALTLVIGKFTLGLDAIAPNTNRLEVTEEQIEGYTAALEAELVKGTFDAAIVTAQALGQAQADKVAAKAKEPKADTSNAEETSGLDLDALNDDSEAQPADSEEQPEVDTEEL